MSRIVIITASPRDPGTGAVAAQRLAGGGQATPYYFRGEHWRAGVADIPRFRSAIGFDETGWTSGSIPTTATIAFAPSTPAALEELAQLYWRDAVIVIEAGEESVGDPAWAVLVTGTVAGVEQADGRLVMTLTDLGGPLDRPVVTERFTGGGGLQGTEEAAGRIKRRTWGRAFNIEGRVFDKAYNIYEFGDPAFPWQAIDELRDIGRAGSRALIPWQGSASATLAALRGTAAPEGGGLVAPSICMARWWTQPNGPLTADVRGEIGTGYVETVPEIAARIAGLASVTVANVSASAAIRGAVAGYHIDSDTETTANALDRLLLPVSLSWALDPVGVMRFLPFTFDDPIETVRSIAVRRQKTLPPMGTRRIGYQRAWRTHSDGEISATLYAGDVAFSNGRPLDELKDVEVGADVTGAHISADTANVHGRPVAQVIDDLDFNGMNWFELAHQFAIQDGIMLARTTLFGQPIGTIVAGAVSQATTDRESSAEQFAILGAKYDDNVSLISDLSSATATGIGSVTTRVSSLEATSTTSSASITNLSEIVIGPDGTTARALWALDVDGKISGVIGTNDGVTRRIELLWDVYDLKLPSGASAFYALEVDGLATVYMPNVVVDTLDINTAVVPAEVSSTTSVAGTYASLTGTASPRATTLTMVVTVTKPGRIVVWVSASQSITTNGPWSLSVAVDGVDIPSSRRSGGNAQDVFGTSCSFLAATPADYVITTEWAGYTGIHMGERNMVAFGLPSTT